MGNSMFKNLLFFFLLSIILLSDGFAVDEEDKKVRSSWQTSQPFPDFNFDGSNQRDLNEWVALYGIEVYSHLNNSGNFEYPMKDEYSTNSEHWEAFSLFGESVVRFEKRKNVSASLALESLLMNQGKFDCRIALHIVFMECVRKLIGDTLFNRLSEQFEQEPLKDLFNPDDTKRLILAGNESLNPYFRLTSHKCGSLYRLGKVGFFEYTPNIKEYATLHPQGFLRGDNGLLCLSNDGSTLSYIGYGDFYKVGPRSWNEMKTRFKEETLNLSTPEEIIVDASRIPVEVRGRYIDQMKRIHKTRLQDEKELMNSLKDTYDDKFTNLQNSFNKSAFFIDLEKVKTLLKS
jgi:hypothetical protein